MGIGAFPFGGTNWGNTRPKDSTFFSKGYEPTMGDGIAHWNRKKDWLKGERHMEHYLRIIALKYRSGDYQRQANFIRTALERDWVGLLAVKWITGQEVNYDFLIEEMPSYATPYRLYRNHPGLSGPLDHDPGNNYTNDLSREVGMHAGLFLRSRVRGNIFN